MFIVKVPVVSEEKTKGCEKFGDAILESLKEIHSNEQGNIIDANLLELKEILVDNSNFEKTDKLIYENALEIFKIKSRAIFLGRDHSITYHIGKAFLKNCKQENKIPCLIIFDAHADCSKSLKVISRNWLKKLIGESFPSENVLIVGARNLENSEMQFIKENKIKMISMNSLTEDLRDLCDTIMEFSNGKELYISIDADVIDPVFAPAISFPEIGGLTSRQFIYLIQRMKKIKTLVGVDITEINIDEDKKFNMTTTRLGAKILSELI